MPDRHIEAIPERWITYTYRTSDENELEVCAAMNPKQLLPPREAIMGFRACW